MRSLRLVAPFILALAGALTVFACEDDETAIIRERIDAGATDAAGGGDGSACDLAVPTTYESPAFEVNAAEELGLRARFEALLKPMRDFEAASVAGPDGGAPDGGVSASTLAALYAEGAPSMRLATTVYYQGKIDAYFTDYEAATQGTTYSPLDPPTSPPGALADLASTIYYFNARGVDLHQAIEKGLYNAAFFNHASLLVGPGQSITVATIDRLVAAFGANPSFPNSPSAPSNPDVYAASFAARRDSNDPAVPGPYQRAKAALIRARAAVAAGPGCESELDAAIKTFFLEWEESQFASVVYDLADERAKLAPASKDRAAILHAHGEALGLVAGFRTIDATRRKITDTQIDSLLEKLFAPNGLPAEVYKVVTAPSARETLGLAAAEIKSVYGFTDAQMTEFETNYP